MPGGYDQALPDNIETLIRLQDLAESFDLSHSTIHNDTSSPPPDTTQVVFLLNFSTAQRTYLLTSPHTLGLLYTPANEHFGIVPIEAMACGLPVIAADSGGPTETIIDLAKSPGKGTGFLLPPQAGEWRVALDTLLRIDPLGRKKIAESAQARVREKFSLDTLGEELETACRDALKNGEDVHGEIGDKLIWFGAGLMGFAAVNLGLVWWLYGSLS